MGRPPGGAVAAECCRANWVRVHRSKTMLLRMRRLTRWSSIIVLVALTSCGGGATPSASGSGSGVATTELTFTLVATHGPADVEGMDVLGYIAIGPDGNLYVPNAGSSEMIVLDADLQVVRRWGEEGEGPGQFGFLRNEDPDSALGGVDVGDDGTIYVVEAGNKRVQRFSADGESQLTWGSRGSGEGQFLDPIGVAVSPAGEVYVVDDERDDIQVFTADGEYLRTIGRKGTGDGELQFTGNIRFAPDGSLVNADFGNGRVQAWGAGDAFLWSIGSQGTGHGEFNEPQDVAFGADGTLFVVDDSRVQAFDSERQLIGTWPDEPLGEHLASIALNGETLWVVAPYIDTLFEIDVAGL